MGSDEESLADDDTASEALDLSDIDLSMDDDAASESDTAVDIDQDELDFDLDADLASMTDSEPSQDVEDTDSEELDFSDFEETVMLDAPPAIAETVDASDDLGEELELELDLDLEMTDDDLLDTEPKRPSMEKEDVDLEDLDFELDMELGKDAAEADEDEDAEDVDLSDIEKMLEVDGEEAETINLAPGLDDVETEVEKWKESSGADDLLGETGEIDLSDIMIDADEDDIEVEMEDVELELDIDEASLPGKAAGKGTKPDDIDISGFEEFDIPAEGAQVEGDFGGGDIELEFEVDGDTDDLDDMATVSDAEEIGAGDETVQYADPLVDEGEVPTKKEVKKKAKKIKPARKSSVLRPVLILLILIVLPLAAIVLLDRFMDIKVPYATDYLKQVPYINQMMKTEMKQVGEISVDNISSKFVDSTHHGKLFVITGTVKNEFPESRKYIKVRGSLFSAVKRWPRR